VQNGVAWMRENHASGGARMTMNSHGWTRMRMTKNQMRANRMCFFVDSIFLGSGEEQVGDGWICFLQVVARNGL